MNKALAVANHPVEAPRSELKVLTDITIAQGKCLVKGSPQRFVAFADAVNLYQKKYKGAPLVAEGAYISPDPLSPTYSFGAYICEVAVNLMTGEVRVIKKTSSSNLQITNNIQISISNDRNHTRRILPSSAFRRYGFYQR